MNKEFQVHRLNERGLERAANIAGAFDYLLDTLKGLLPEGRELSIVKTKLEEGCFFAKKAIANDPENNEVQ
jgi:hypothetical protein